MGSRRYFAIGDKNGSEEHAPCCTLLRFPATSTQSHIRSEENSLSVGRAAMWPRRRATSV
eukprot:6202146-Pleurochrysis_carterae.AAC.1